MSLSPGLEEKIEKDSLARAFRKPKTGLWICARFCSSDLRILCSILCFGFADVVLDFVLRTCGCCARFCASDLRMLCSILCFGLADVVLDFVLRICGCCARFCASELRMLCSISCFGFADFVLDFVLRICGFCARLCASDLRIVCLILCFGFADCAKSCARRNPTRRNQEHEKPGFGAREIMKFSFQLRVRKSKFW